VTYCTLKFVHGSHLNNCSFRSH